MTALMSLANSLSMVPEALRQSSLMRAGGCIVHSSLVSPERCGRLLSEARQCLVGAVESNVVTRDVEEVRGGSPARRFVSAPGGPEQTSFFQCDCTSRLLTELCGVAVQPTGKVGTFTYYRPGDFLSVHRDVETCDVSVITCLLDRYAPNSSGGTTRLYPNRQHELLSRVRATPSLGAARVRLPVGSTMIFFGGLIPHLIEPLGPQDFRIVSVLCFEVSNKPMLRNRESVSSRVGCFETKSRGQRGE